MDKEDRYLIAQAPAMAEVLQRVMRFVRWMEENDGADAANFLFDLSEDVEEIMKEAGIPELEMER